MAEAPSESDLLRGSDSNHGIVCHPCGFEGRKNEAGGYCLDCSEYMCSMCIRHHKNLSLTRHHKLLDRENMPTDPGTAKVKDVCTERCQSHEDEIVKYHCPAHKLLGCSVCVTLEHTNCKNVAYIPEACKDFQNSEDYNAFRTRLAALVTRSETILTLATESRKDFIENCSRVLQDVEAFKTQIVERLNEQENEIKSQIEKMKKSQNERFAGVSDMGTDILAKLRSMSATLEALAVKNLCCQMFIYTKNSEYELSELNDQLEKVDVKCSPVFTFKAGEELQTEIQKNDTLGSIIEKDPAGSEMTHVKDISLSPNRWFKRRDRSISGLTLLSKDKVVIVDNADFRIILADAVNNLLISELKPESTPWDVATISQDLVAATLTSVQKIVLVTCRDKLTIDREIKVSGLCRGIDCAQDRLFVSYRYPLRKVEILSMSGAVLKRFSTNDQGDTLFNTPYYVCVSANKQSIYVSDMGKNAVIQLDMDGQVKTKYTDNDLKLPRKMAVERTGLVYVCGEVSNNVHLLTPQCRKVKIFRPDGLTGPLSLCYLDATARLYIGMHPQNRVKVYQVK